MASQTSEPLATMERAKHIASTYFIAFIMHKAELFANHFLAKYQVEQLSKFIAVKTADQLFGFYRDPDFGGNPHPETELLRPLLQKIPIHTLWYGNKIAPTYASRDNTGLAKQIQKMVWDKYHIYLLDFSALDENGRHIVHILFARNQPRLYGQIPTWHGLHVLPPECNVPIAQPTVISPNEFVKTENEVVPKKK